jgi:hypothetical protein
MSERSAIGAKDTEGGEYLFGALAALKPQHGQSPLLKTRESKPIDKFSREDIRPRLNGCPRREHGWGFLPSSA